MGRMTTKGSRFYIGGFGPLQSESAWVEISDVVNGGELSEQFAEITYTVLNPGEERYEKGAKGTALLTLELVLNDGDSGQADLEAAANDVSPDRDYNFKIDIGPDPVSSTGAAPAATFKCKVMSFARPLGDSTNMVRATAGIRPITNTITITPGVA